MRAEYRETERMLVLSIKNLSGDTMKTTILLALIAFATTSAFAEDKGSDAKKAEMMKKWQDYATPGAPC